MIRFWDETLPTLADNLALDEALLLEAEETGREAMRLWEWPDHAVVLGAGGRLHDDVNVDACRADGVPILRRSSGGGTVLLGRGCLLFSLIIAYRRDARLNDVRASYRVLLEPIARELNLSILGYGDLIHAGKKVSGNSQQRKRDHLLHHGTLLYDFPLEQIERYLKEPKRQPEYREQKPHGEFVCNLPRPREKLIEAMLRAWPGARTTDPLPRDRIKDLVRDKYDRPEWIERW